MKILVVSPYPPQQDGIGVHARDLVRALRGLAAVAVLTRSGAPAAGGPPAGGVVEDGDSGERVYRILSARPAALRLVRRCMRNEAPEVIHYQFNIAALGLSWTWPLLAGLAARRSGTSKLVFTLHEVRRDTALLGPVGVAVFRRISASADALVVYTEEARRLLVERCGASPGVIELMPHGAPDEPPAAEEGESEAVLARYGLAKPPILYFGYLHPDKGIEHLIDAAAELSRRRALGDTPVVVAGGVRRRRGAFRVFELRDRAYERRLRAQVARLGLEGTVRFLGYVEQAETWPLLRSACCGVLPYRDSTQSGVLNLLVAAHTPVVASDLPGLRETLGDAGRYSAAGDAAGLASQLEALLGDDGLREQSAKAMATLHEQIGLGSVGRALYGLYERLGAAAASPSGAASR